MDTSQLTDEQKRIAWAAYEDAGHEPRSMQQDCLFAAVLAVLASRAPHDVEKAAEAAWTVRRAGSLEWMELPDAAKDDWRKAVTAAAPFLRGETRCLKPAAPLTALSYFCCVLPKNHDGECKQGGNCTKHGEYVGKNCPKWPACIKEIVRGQFLQEREGAQPEPPDIPLREDLILRKN